ncbi:MAG TPA: hypothetical protein VMC03_09905 [Streptosporangiaceae bacterium]|nr:hypothetical protein [Streptosporangiaceae bacterium]
MAQISDRPLRRHAGRAAADPGGNQRLTAMTGAVLLVLFTAECLTLLSLGPHLALHFFLGMLLIGPVCLKAGSTLWRFTRYYTGSAAYVRRGPPPLPQRVLGPLVMLTSLAVLFTGVMLAVEGPGDWTWHALHQRAFLAWAVVIIVHVATYAPKLPRLLAGPPTEHAGGAAPPGPASRAHYLLAARLTRWLLLGGSLAVGLILGLLTYHLSGRWGG